MADNTSTNVTPTAPAPAPATSSRTLGPVRQAIGLLVGVAGLLLLALAAFYFANATALGTTEDGVPESWSAGFKHREVWPIAVWSLTFGVVGLALAGLLAAGKGRQGDPDTPAGLGRLVAFVCFAGVLCLLCVPIYLVSTRTFSLALNPVAIWSSLSLVILAACGILLLVEGPTTEESRFRLLLLGMGISLGTVTFVLGVALATITFWNDIGKGLDTWREKPAVLIWPVAAYLVGLALVFVSAQVATPLVRTDQNIRRVVFGSNLLVTVLLVMGILTLPNVLAWAEPLTRFFGRSYDWTDSGFHSLSDRTRNFLAGQREPVKVYVLLPSGHPVTKDVLTMLANCRSLNGKIEYELVDPTVRATAERRREFMSKYNLTDPSGLLLVSGTGEKGEFAFIKTRDLFEQAESRSRRSGPSYTFKGEGVFLNALLSLAEGTVKIYFTTGHGELSLDGGMPPMPGKMPRGGGDLSTLKMRLTDRDSVKVESLTIDDKTKEIPKDANVVVIARPRQPFSKEEVKVLREYLRRERKTRKEKLKDKGDIEREVEEVTTGKLFILLDPILQKEGRKTTVTPTGLNELLEEYGVKVGDNRILAARRPSPEDILAIADDQAGNPIAQAFNRGDRVTLFSFRNARTVEPLDKGPRGGAATEVLLEVPSVSRILPQFVWAETNFDLDPQALRESLIRDEARLEKTISRRPLSVAVTVADTSGPPGMPMDAPHAPARKETPRMVVVGSASWITDEGLGGEAGVNRIALFTSCLTWLNAKTEAIGASSDENKQRKLYIPEVTPDNQTRLHWVPLLLMMAAVLIVGMGVWVVRRR